MVSYTLGHKQGAWRTRGPALLHGVFLYGFLMLGIGHLEIVLEGLTAFLRAFGDRPFSYERVLPSGLNAAYHLSQDLLAAAVLAAGDDRARPPLVGSPAAAAAALEGRREDPLVHRRALRDVLRPRRADASS